jgi:L-asparaginase
VPVEVVGSVAGSPGSPRLFLLYTGGTVGMVAGPDGALAPLPLTELVHFLPVLTESPIGLTLASVTEPIDSSSMTPGHWVDIADALVAHAPGHDGIVVLHGTDTMAYTASALSFLLDGVSLPIVLTGSQRPVTALRSDGRENLVTAAAIAATQDAGHPVLPEVAVHFGSLCLRGNRSVKVNTDSYHGFASPNHPPLAVAGTTIEFDRGRIRPPATGPLRRTADPSPDVVVVRLHPALDAAGFAAALSRPGTRGVVLEAYGSGNGPDAPWFLDGVRRAVDAGIVVVTTTQCQAGTVRGEAYEAGVGLLEAGSVSAGDMTLEAALTKLMVLLGRHDDPSTVRRLLGEDLAGELTPGG